MLDPTSGMTDAQKSSYDRKVMNKVYSGKKLSAEEMRYIKIHYPGIVSVCGAGADSAAGTGGANQSTVIQKKEVQDVTVNAMFHISRNE